MTGTADRSPTQPIPAAGTSAREVLRSGTDPDEALEFYRGVYDGRDMAFAPSSSPFGFRYRATGDGRLSLRTSSVSAARSGILAPERQYLLAWSVEGGIVVDDDVLLRVGAPVMYPAGRPFHVSTPAGTTHLLHFDADFLEAVAVVGTGTAAVPLVLPVTASATRLAPLQAVLRAVARPLLDVAVVGAERTALDLRLAEAVLEAFRSDDGRRRSAAPAGAVERAKAFMSAHFDRTIAATDIAAAAEVSVRTLQEGFQRREGSTPMAYLRDLRLEQARLGLRLADARETSVAAVAHSCGFRHMGRFSGSYYAMYGEHPGDTLRGRRRLIAAADIVG